MGRRVGAPVPKPIPWIDGGIILNMGGLTISAALNWGFWAGFEADI